MPFISGFPNVHVPWTQYFKSKLININEIEIQDLISHKHDDFFLYERHKPVMQLDQLETKQGHNLQHIIQIWTN